MPPFSSNPTTTTTPSAYRVSVTKLACFRTKSPGVTTIVVNECLPFKYLPRSPRTILNSVGLKERFRLGIFKPFSEEFLKICQTSIYWFVSRLQTIELSAYSSSFENDVNVVIPIILFLLCIWQSASNISIKNYAIGNRVV